MVNTFSNLGKKFAARLNPGYRKTPPLCHIIKGGLSNEGLGVNLCQEIKGTGGGQENRMKGVQTTSCLRANVGQKRNSPS